MNKKAKRYNTGKNRYELIPPFALEKLAEVYTRGAHKYTVYEDENGVEILGKDIPFEQLITRKLTIKEDGAFNWRKGLDWMGAMGSIERHIQAWKNGEDIDPDLKTYHLGNAAWGLMSLLEYYKIAPQFDDRQHTYLKPLKIGLDVDEIIANWVGAWIEKWKLNVPQTWFFQRGITEKFDEMRKNGELDEFYMNLKPLIKPEDIPFEPHCYITSRPVDKKITEQWLDKHSFPSRPVFAVDNNKSKVDVAKESGIDIFVDDRYENFVELNNAGICCFLYDSPHNQRYRVGHKRIYSLKELM